ncbi:MAG: ABC transporter ATP-binding protein [Halarsenatibacteraceae bacterium]
MVLPKNLIEIKNLKKYFSSPAGPVKAVDNINLSIQEGETIGIVGESGCGKSTLIKSILQLIKPTSGEVIYEDTDICKINKKELRDLRKKIGFVSQDPHASLNPRMTVFDTLSRPLKIHKITETKEDTIIEIVSLLKDMGLQTEHLIRFPHELSGGQKQRIGIARALAVHPRIIFLDEPTSALDVSVQTKILKLLDKIKDNFNLTYLYISHDINLIKVISNRIGVMYLGKIVEIGNTKTIYNEPKHPYTVGLFKSSPSLDPDNKTEDIYLKGEVPSPTNTPTGCNFRLRCPHATKICEIEEPELKKLSDGREVSCHLY